MKGEKTDRKSKVSIRYWVVPLVARFRHEALPPLLYAAQCGKESGFHTGRLSWACPFAVNWVARVSDVKKRRKRSVLALGFEHTTLRWASGKF